MPGEPLCRAPAEEQGPRPRVHPLRLLLTTVAVVALVAPAAFGEQPILFLMAEPPPSVVYYDSFVLPLNGPSDIAQARKLIEQGPAAGPNIAVARIVAGADGLNRDYLASAAPHWSWHVSEFLGFADSTIEVCDGTPQQVEQDVQGWIANTQATICFWRYTVVAELAFIPQPQLSIVRVGPGSFKIGWAANANGFILEAATSVPATVWQAVTNRIAIESGCFTVDLEALGMERWYRLRAP